MSPKTTNTESSQACDATAGTGRESNYTLENTEVAKRYSEIERLERLRGHVCIAYPARSGRVSVLANEQLVRHLRSESETTAVKKAAVLSRGTRVQGQLTFRD